LNKKHNFSDPHSNIILCIHVTLQPTASQKQGVLQTGSAQVGTLKPCSCAFPNGSIHSMCYSILSTVTDHSGACVALFSWLIGGSKGHFHAGMSRLIFGMYPYTFEEGTLYFETG